ncbi:hypothetical protein HN873_019251 [Arachis hypogaea]
MAETTRDEDRTEEDNRKGGISMQEGKQSLKTQDTGNRATPESPQSANSRTECREVIIAGQSNTKEDEGQLMQLAIGQCLTTEKGRKWKRIYKESKNRG